MDAREDVPEELLIEVTRLRLAVESLRNSLLTVGTLLAADKEPTPAVLQAYQGIVAEIYKGFAGGSADH
jgi:hypothetical protein